MKKKIYGALLVLCLLTFSNISVQAANPKTATLKEGKTYTQYDITGDKKPDKFKITVKRDSRFKNITGFQLFVNGKNIYTENKGGLYAEDFIAKLLTVENKPFLFIEQVGENEMTSYCRIFQYREKTMKSIVDFAGRYKKSPFIMTPYHTAVEDIRVSGNKIIAKYHGMNYSLGVIRWNVIYRYKNGTLINESNTNNLVYSQYGPVSNTWKAARTIKIYKTKNVDSGVCFTIYEGDTVKITKMYCKGINTWFFVQKGNKSGWMKSAMKQPPYADYYFYGAYYAG